LPAYLQIKARLSQLGKTADGLRTAYLRLEITQGTDMQTAAQLSAFPDLQILVLSNNELKDLSHLSYLPDLIHLDVSNNKLVEVLVTWDYACLLL
jgi:Leucine-rich repeat (LRR) protein